MPPEVINPPNTRPWASPPGRTWPSQRLSSRHFGSAQRIITDLFALADIRIGGDRPWDLRVNDLRFYRRVLATGTLGFGEAYMDGWWDCAAIDEMTFRALRAELAQHLPLNPKTIMAGLVAKVFNLQTVARARRSASAHYDLGNRFFAAMLDPSMQYSCAYFQGTDDLAEAQRRKMDLICRKLGLRSGHRLLDIGCGWGGLSRYAAEHYGCSVVGITVSAEQRDYAVEASRGLPVEIRLQDYRELNEPFDRIASVGMMEHVGYKNYGAYMAAAARCLDVGGLFLCHTIGGTASRTGSDPWITRYIFPNSMLPSPAQVTHAAEERFVVEDVHNFGAYYDRTLMAWEENFRRSWDQFRNHYGERFGRMWRYYLLSCAGAFRARDIELFQFVLAKGGVLGGYQAVR
ncbi:MAG: cyclopropane-fatty-acyl-phospholipid synthase [Verrucomicrobia bacterium]|nr:cyclopropane-fatty-acyl-phospholipid synthase [Verrucomicrobiota bacterium]